MFSKNKAFFLFLLKFAGTYLLLSLLYWAYLSRYDAAAMQVDGITHIVARQSSGFLHWFGVDATIAPSKAEASYRLFINGKSMVRIVEGCNAISVMILFASFIMAFSTTFKRTSLYIACGIIILHILNIVRIALLSLGLYHYREYKDVLHDIVFPLFIYGVVFVLWVVWVIKISGYAKKTTA